MHRIRSNRSNSVPPLGSEQSLAVIVSLALQRIAHLALDVIKQLGQLRLASTAGLDEFEQLQGKLGAHLQVAIHSH